MEDSITTVDLPAGSNPNIAVTTFNGVKGRTADRHERPWLEVVDALRDPPERARKADCKLIKLATFGELRSAKGSLRHDANVVTIFGIEGDYDAGIMTPAEAAALLTASGVECLVYTTPSHKHDASRWRVLCPLSSPCDPQERAQHVDKLDAILGGVLAAESWTISQTYYVGKVAGSPYEFRHVRGVCIDTLPPVVAAQPTVVASPAAHAGATDEALVFDILARASSDEKFKRLWNGDITGYESPSEADAALCEKLAFYTGRDPDAIDSAFRASALVRDKWEREDYRDRTIKRAVQWCREVHRDFKTAASKGRFKPIPAAEFARQDPPPWIIKRVLPQAELGVIFGESGSGKSFFAIDLVMNIARGLDWRGHKVRQGKVVYVCAEGAGDFILRLRAYAHQHGVDLGDIPLSIIADAPNLATDEDADSIAAELADIGGASVVVVDTLAATTPGADENTGKDMGLVINRCQAISKAAGAMVLLVAHSGKDPSRGMRGWSGTKGAIDVEIEVTRSGDDRVATVTKLKGGQDGAEFGFKLLPVVLGVDEDGDDITSCVLDNMAAVPKSHRRSRKLGDVEKIVLRAVKDLVAVHGEADVSEIISEASGQIAPPAGRDTRRQRILRALEGLTAEGILTLQGTGYALV